MKKNLYILFNVAILLTSLWISQFSYAAAGGGGGGEKEDAKAEAKARRIEKLFERHNIRDGKYAIIGCGHFKGDYPVTEDISEIRKAPEFHEGNHEHKGVITLNINSAYNPDVTGSILDEADVKKMADKGPYDIVYMELGGLDLVKNPGTHKNAYSLVKPGGSYVFDGISRYGIKYHESANRDSFKEEENGDVIYVSEVRKDKDIKEPYIVYRDQASKEPRYFAISASRPLEIIHLRKDTTADWSDYNFRRSTIVGAKITAMREFLKKILGDDVEISWGIPLDKLALGLMHMGVHWDGTMRRTAFARFSGHTHIVVTKPEK